MYKEPLKINNATKKALHIGDISDSYILFLRSDGAYMDIIRYESGEISFEVTNGTEFTLNTEQWVYVNCWMNYR
jgi:hypothetical protein